MVTVMASPTLIYCADGNARFAEIAINAGFLYGARLPARGLPFVPWFADQDWKRKRPDRERYMAELAKYRPTMATVLDWETEEQLKEVLGWAEDAARYVEQVLIIPKVIGGIEQLPRFIGGKEVILAYSVPTSYGGTSVPAWEFRSWPVHLLGGSPHAQMRLAHYMSVVSADGNYHQLMASRYCEFWQNGKWCELDEHQEHIEHDAIYIAFQRSCENIINAWSRLTTIAGDGAAAARRTKQRLVVVRQKVR